MLGCKNLVEAAFEQIGSITPQNASSELLQAIDEILTALESGNIRVAEQIEKKWQINTWIKKAILLYFRCYDNQLISGNFGNYFDKIPSKFATTTKKEFNHAGLRVVPPAYARKGCFIGKHTVLMPSFVNIGAYIDTGCMIDTFATVGSCAQIGKNVHLATGVGIGGVLEPLQAEPTIIEDDCFIGAGSQVVEGVIIGKGSVIATGVFIGQSTKIYDREKNQVYYGKVPAGSVVVAGTIPSKQGNCNIAAAIVVKTVDATTRAKVGINKLLHIVD